MKVYVISLADATERRKKIKEQLDQQQVSFEFFDAKRGNPDIKANLNYDYAFRDRMYGRQMTAGEIGCFMSHQELWKVIASSNEIACIMEDDVILANNFDKTLGVLSRYTNYDILRLSGIFNRKKFIWQKFNGLSMVKYWRDPMGTQCYIIKPVAAEVMLERSALINAPVDDFLGNYALHRLNVVGCEPYPIMHDWDIPSQLGHRHSKRKMLVTEKIHREILLQTTGAINFIIQFAYFLKAKFGWVK